MESNLGDITIALV